jgi:Glutamyl-tRNAGlu reductase, dimerisation domain
MSANVRALTLRRGWLEYDDGGSTDAGIVAREPVSRGDAGADRRYRQRDHGDDPLRRESGRRGRRAAEAPAQRGGIAFALTAAMSGTTVRRALRSRFETIRRAEVERLNKKLRGLSEAERQSAEAIIADIVHAIASVPERTLDDDTPPAALHALVHLFDLRGDPTLARH